MKHLLVPLDFSSGSINALEHAILIANQLDCGIRLIHVKRKNADYDASFNLHDFDEVLKSGVLDNFDRIIDLYKKDLKGEFDYRIREGRIYTEICHQAKYGDAEMIVMGTHGVSGFEERWVGSNAFRVVSNSSVPVLTIRSSFPSRAIRKVVLPIDINKDSRHKVTYVTEMALLFGAELHVIDIREDNKVSTRKILTEYTDQVMAYLKRRKVTCVRESLKGNSLSEMVIEYSLMTDADLVSVLITPYEHSPHFFGESSVQQMVNHSPIPILSIRMHE
jgi:nucleotide-binding universal stress UspA family protein